MMGAEVWAYRSGAWVREGAQTVEPGGSLIHGATLTDSNTGIARLSASTQSAIAANVVTSDVILSGISGTPDAPLVVDLNQTIAARLLIVNCQHVRVRNFKITGPPRETYSTGTVFVGLVDATDYRNVGNTVEDFTIDAEHPNEWITGVTGHHLTIRRGRIKNVVDAAHVIWLADAAGTLAGPGSAEFKMLETYTSDLTYFSPDRPNSRPNTHNDCLQIPGWGGVTVRRCRLAASASTTRGSGFDGYAAPEVANGYAPSVAQGVGITQNVNAADAPIVIEDNLFEYGVSWIIWITGGKTNATGIPHRFRRNVGDLSTLKAYLGDLRPVVISPAIDVPAMPAVTGADKAISQGGSGNVDRLGKYLRTFREES